eukprot:TRINITY_DN79074_c0_g1_i1.p1 TRINITY_DN79074_c0_g1~~TRINITY_DN79074_c0_g1_i1.p1  ORF type:complete len:246 (+),score=56.55 TRINITY_DN79074_c0_g1_i1:73-810(+)
MAKLYFRHGAMSSAKTLNLLATAHSYEVQSKKVKVMKPKMDTRWGADTVKSRAGMDRQADILLTPTTTFSIEDTKGISCVLVDEAQFLAPAVIDRLKDIAAVQGVPVICYGLRTDFRSRLFPGSKRLMELADSIEEVKTTCHYCNRKATMNLKSVDGKATMEGPTVCLGADELYVPACYTHFCEKIVQATGKVINFPEAWAAGDAADAAQRELPSPVKDQDTPKETPSKKRKVEAEPDLESPHMS